MEHRLLYWLIAVASAGVIDGRQTHADRQARPDQDDRGSILYYVLKAMLGSDESMVPTAFDKNVSAGCYQASRRYLQAIKRFEVWALASKCHRQSSLSHPVHSSIHSFIRSFIHSLYAFSCRLCLSRCRSGERISRSRDMFIADLIYVGI